MSVGGVGGTGGGVEETTPVVRFLMETWKGTK